MKKGEAARLEGKVPDKFTIPSLVFWLTNVQIQHNSYIFVFIINGRFEKLNRVKKRVKKAMISQTLTIRNRMKKNAFNLPFLLEILRDKSPDQKSTSQ